MGILSWFRGRETDDEVPPDSSHTNVPSPDDTAAMLSMTLQIGIDHLAKGGWEKIDFHPLREHFAEVLALGLFACVKGASTALGNPVQAIELTRRVQTHLISELIAKGVYDSDKRNKINAFLSERVEFYLGILNRHIRSDTPMDPEPLIKDTAAAFEDFCSHGKSRLTTSEDAESARIAEQVLGLRWAGQRFWLSMVEGIRDLLRAQKEDKANTDSDKK